MGELKDYVFKNLKYRIIMKQLKPGEVLNEKKLIEEYGIGRTPLREIFIELQREGLIQKFPRSGTIVSPMDFNQLKEVSEIRIPLEGLVGELAAQKITGKQIEELKKVYAKIAEIEKLGSDEDILMYDTKLHDILYEAAGNTRLHTLIHELQAIDARYWFAITFTKEHYDDQLKQWKEIIDAIEKRDKAKARDLLEKHVEKFINRFLNHL